jgi:hypothetical protein
MSFPHTLVGLVNDKNFVEPNPDGSLNVISKEYVFSGGAWIPAPPPSGSTSAMSSVVYFDGTDIYECEAVAGSATTSAVWKVEKWDTASAVIGLFANGAGTYINLASDLATVKALSYA